MGQSQVSKHLPDPAPVEIPLRPVRYLTAESAESCNDASYVVIVRTPDEFSRWLLRPGPGAVLLQVEGLIGDVQGWALAAQGRQPIPLDVILDDPASEYSSLYRLVDVRNSRPVRVTIPARGGFMKALRLAVSLRIPVRLLPGQPDAAHVADLLDAADFYLHDPMVEVPVEFFHSLLGVFCQAEPGTLWDFLEQSPDPVHSGNDFDQSSQDADLVKSHLARIITSGGECASCRWQSVCAGYFKHPDPTYNCAGVKQLFNALESAADEIRRDLVGTDSHNSP